MDNETTSAVDSAATSSAPATIPAHSEQTNTASGTRVPPLGECGGYQADTSLATQLRVSMKMCVVFMALL